MFLQVMPNSDEGFFIWIVIITVVSTMAIVAIKYVIGSIVEYFLVRKDESKERAGEEVRRFSMVFFIFIVGVLLLIFQDSLALFINRPAEEVEFAGFLTIIISIFITGLAYRNTTRRVVGKIRGQ